MSVTLSKQALADYKKIPKSDQSKIKRQLSVLQVEPHAGKKLCGKLKDYYSLRAWPYRILYIIQNKDIWIVYIMHQQGVYKK